MANQCKANKVVGVVVFKVKAFKIEQNRDIRSQSTMTKIMGLNIEGGSVVACEGDEDREIAIMAIIIITTNDQTTRTLTRNPSSQLPKSTLAQTNECHKITFRTHQKLNSWKDTNTIQISIYLSWIPSKRPSISVSSLSQGNPSETSELRTRGFNSFKFKFRKCHKCFGKDSTLEI